MPRTKKGPQEKRATMADIAKLSGVSRPIVSYVLNNTPGKSVSNETKRRILEVMKELDYKPNPFAKALRTKSSLTIGMVLPNVTDSSMGVLVKGVEMAAADSEYTILIHDMESSKDSKTGLEKLADRGIDGILFAFPMDSDEDVIKGIVAKYNLPAVVIGIRYKLQPLDCVRFDTFGAGELIGRHLCELGHKKIAIISRQPSIRRMERLNGIKNAAAQFDVKPDVFYVNDMVGLPVSLYHGTHEYEVGYSKAKEIFANGVPYTAVACLSDFLAVGVINAIQAQGLSVPNDVSVTSIGGQFLSEIMNPKMTVVVQPSYDIGRIALQMLINKIKNKSIRTVDDVMLNAELVVRESTKPLI